MKKGQMSMEIGILLLVAVVCSAIGGYYFSSNVAESGNSAGETASNTNSAFELTSINSINSLSEDFSTNQELSGGSSGSQTCNYWINTTTQLWTKVNLATGTNEFIISKEDSGITSNPDDVFIFFDNFTQTDGSLPDLSKWEVYDEGAKNGIRSVTISGGKLKILTDTTAYGNWDKVGIRSIMEFSQNDNIKITYSMPSYSNNNCYPIQSLLDSSYIGDLWTSSAKQYQTTQGRYYSSTCNYRIFTGTDAIYFATESGWSAGSTFIDTIDVENNEFKVYRNNVLKASSSLDFMTYDYDLCLLHNSDSISSQVTYYDNVIVQKFIKNTPTVDVEVIDENSIKVIVESTEDVSNYQIPVDITNLGISSTDELLKVSSI